jgi:hypothetical protein
LPVAVKELRALCESLVTSWARDKRGAGQRWYERFKSYVNSSKLAYTYLE